MKRAPRHPDRRNQGTVWSGPAAILPSSSPKGTSPKFVACPDCKAEPETPCIALGMRPPVKKGDVMKSYHPSRKRMAVRLDNEERERAGDLKPREPWEHKPGVMESEDGHECPVCHLKIKATISGLRIATHTMKGGKFNRNGSVHCQGSGTKLSNEAT